MNNKRRIDKQYAAPSEVHLSKWERIEVFKIGRRALRPGQVVKIHGQRAAQFMFLHGERHIETGAINLTFVGGRQGHRLTRAFKPEQVGAFLYMGALAKGDES